MKKRIICAAICLLLLGLCGCGKSTATKELEKGIRAMEEVTADSQEVLSELRAAYDALSAEEQETVDEELLDQLENAEKICAALTFEEAVAELGEVTESSGEALASVRTMYDGMTKGAKALIDEDILQEFLDAETAYDDLLAGQVLSQIMDAKLLTIDEAYEIAFSYETKNEELLQLQQDIADLALCDGTFYQNGKYKSELVIYLQYGEYWFDFDYKGYTGNVSENKLVRDGENGFLFKASTNGSHFNYFTGYLDTTYFTLRFAENKLFVAWGSSEYYLDREG